MTESFDAPRPEGPRTYPDLLESLREVSRDNQVSGTVDRERRRTRTYWDMGDQIHQHLLRNQGKPRYAERVISKLANDLEMGKTLLYDILHLRRAFPIFRTCGRLPWSHCGYMLPLATQAEREFYARVAVEMGWSVRQLREEIRRGLYAQAREHGEASYRPQQPILPTQLQPRRGHPYTYRLVSSLPGQGHADLVVDLGPRSWTVERLRLRGIDAERLDTRAGQRARDRVEELIRSVDFVVLSTARTDRYGRYLAEVFCSIGVTDPAGVAAKGRYLNRQLLEEGLAGAYV